jgi:ribosome biogenesis GTPase / thiamine phosphate phosphatase
MANGIETYGWNETWQNTWDDGSCGGLVPARVTARWRGQWEVACGQGVMLAQLAGKFCREQPEDAFPEVGDFVGVRLEQGSALISALLPRENALLRHMAFSVSGRQVIAANVDVGFATMALDRDFNPRRLERYITAIVEGCVQPVALLTKTDLCPGYWAKVYSLTDTFPGLAVLPICALTGEGMEELGNYLAPGTTAVIIGSSGVGKSTLLNALYGSEVMHTAGLRSDGFRGSHTTTNRQMAVLPSGALFIDTPGMRELGVVGEGEGLAQSFPDIAELATACRFRDCNHVNEPGCAVREAVDHGRLDSKRLKSYRSISKEMEREQAKAEFRLNHLQRNDGRMKRREERVSENEY